MANNKDFRVKNNLFVKGLGTSTFSGDVSVGDTITVQGAATFQDDVNFNGAFNPTTINASGNVVIGGNLTVNGTTTTVDTNNLNVKDKNITLNYSTGDSSALANGAGITIQDAVNSTTDATILWNTSDNRFDFSNHIGLPDDKRIKLGDGNDLQIFHNSSNNHSVIAESGSGDLRLSADDLYIKNATATENKAVFLSDGSVKLYYDNAEKIKTTSTGAQITGTLDVDVISNASGTVHLNDTLYFQDNSKAVFGDSSDLQIYHDGSNSRIHDNGTGGLILSSSQFIVKNSAQNENMIVGTQDGSVNLYYDNNLKLSTTGNGVVIPYGQSYWIGATSDAGDRGRFHATSGNLFIDWGSAGTLFFRSGSNSSANRATLDSSGNFNAIGSYQLNGTTVIDTSRNLTNIGTISSGAITSSGDLAIDTDTLFVDVSTERVGINTTPSRPLHVKDSDDVVAFFESTDTNAVIHIKDPNTGISVGSISGDAIFAADIDQVGSKNILFKNAGATKATLNTGGSLDTLAGYSVGTTQVIDSSRNIVNVGTISSGTITSSGSLVATTAVISNITANGSGSNILVKNNGGSNIARFNNDLSTNFFGAITSSSNLTLGANGIIDTASGHIIFKSAGGTQGQFTSTGFSVVGNTAISGNFNTSLGGYQVGGTTVIDSARNFTPNEIFLPSKITHFGDNDTYIQFHGNDLFRVVTGGLERFEVSNSGIRINENGADADFTIESDNDANMFFVDGGNDRIGIGTSSPQTKLDTSGTIRATGLSTISGGAGTEIRYDSSNTFGGVIVFDRGTSSYQELRLEGSAIKLKEAGTDVLTVDNNRVGIGTTSPAADLHVESSAPEFRLSQSGTAKVRLRTGGDNYINTGQKLGIGTTSPDTKLDITSSGVNGVLLNQDTSNAAASARLLFKDQTRTNAILNVNGNLELRTGATIGSSSGTKRLVVNGNGNVGIGDNAAPSRQFTVYNTSNAVMALTAGTSSLAQLALGDTGDDNYAQILLDNSTNKLQIQNGGGGAIGDRGITLDSSENVGIGTSSPSEMLHVNGKGFFNNTVITNTAVALKLKQAAGTENDATEFRTGGGEFKIFSGRDSGTHQDFVFATGDNYTSGAERMRIHDNGAITIGNASKLDTAVKLQTTTSSSGVTSFTAYADDIIFEHNNHIGITLATPNDKAGTLAFTDPDSVAPGWIQYDHATNNMNFRAGNAERMRIDSSGLDLKTGNYKVNGTTVIDSSRNLQNINQATIDEIIGTKYRVVDSRNVATTTDEGIRQVRFDFKANNNGDSLSDGGTYHGQMLFQQWNDSSGGDTHALGFTDNGNIWHRRADVGGTWDTWYKIVETGRSMNVSLGTITSGAITSSGDIRANGGDYFTNSGAAGNYRGFGDRLGLSIVNGASYIYDAASTPVIALAAYAGNVHIYNELKMGNLSGTTVIDSSRNLTNIGTYSGSGDMHLTGVGTTLKFDTLGSSASNVIRTINNYETLIGTNRGAAGHIVVGNSNIRMGFGTAYTVAQSDITINSTGTIDIAIPTSFAEDISLPDVKRIKLGTGNDLQLYHDSESVIEDAGTNGLLIITNGPAISIDGGSDVMGKFIKDGAVELYYDNVKRLETTSSGVSMTNGLVVEGSTTFNDDVSFGAGIVSNINAGTNTVTAGAVSIETGAPNLTLKDTTDDDDHQIYFKDNGGTVRYQITSAGDQFNFATNGSRELVFKPSDTEKFRVGTAYNESKQDIRITTGGLRIGSTTVIDSSRNLTNIGLISSTRLNSNNGGYTISYSEGTGQYPNIRVQDTSGTNQYGEVMHINGDTKIRSYNGFFTNGSITFAGNSTYGSFDTSGDLNLNNDLSVTGALSKGSGSFKIDHPLKPDTHHLVHSFVEGPQADNLYRGKIELVDGRAVIDLDEWFGMTPGTFLALNRDLQAFVSNEEDWDAVRAKVMGSQLIIECQNARSKASVSWMVVGERQDNEIYESTLTDDYGKIIVEPEKKVVE